MRKKENPSPGDYCSFIIKYSERSEILMEKRRLDEFTRITLFLRAFKIRTGDKICKKCEVDLENT